MLEDHGDLEQCRQEILQATWQLARRQGTWLRQFPEIHWLDVTADGEHALPERAREAFLNALRGEAEAQQ